MAVKQNVRHMCVMARDDPHFRLRVPDELRARIADAAKANNRSINAEILSRLERSFFDLTGEHAPLNDAERAEARKAYLGGYWDAAREIGVVVAHRSKDDLGRGDALADLLFGEATDGPPRVNFVVTESNSKRKR